MTIVQLMETLLPFAEENPEAEVIFQAGRALNEGALCTEILDIGRSSRGSQGSLVIELDLADDAILEQLGDA